MLKLVLILFVVLLTPAEAKTTVIYENGKRVGEIRHYGDKSVEYRRGKRVREYRHRR